MAPSSPTDFEHVLLGLICVKPSSGYDLKQAFAATPLSVYQPSSGALYPALARLEKKGFTSAKAHPQPVVSGRRRVVYKATPLGHRVHRQWTSRPVDPATVARDLGMHLMRFVMMEQSSTRVEVLGFLRALRDALSGFVTDLERYRQTLAGDPDHAVLALDHGIAVHQASLDWTEHTLGLLSAKSSAIEQAAIREISGP